MKRKLLTTTLGVLIAFCSLAQKSSNQTLVIQATIEPSNALPEKNVTYRSVLRSDIDPLSAIESLDATVGIKDDAKRQQSLEKARKAKMDTYAKEKLAISGSKFIASEANEDWTVLLETSAPKMISQPEKPISELGMDDAVFTFSYAAKLSVTDRTGKIVFEKVISDPSEEQKMPKAVLFFNPGYKMKMAMTRDPEKQKKLNDQMMEKKDHLILSLAVDKADAALKDAFETQVKTFNVSIFSVKGKAFDELNTTSEKIFDTYSKFRAFSKKNRIPKEDMDKVFNEALAVWQKYAAERKSEIEEKAYKGLLLNCALASTWTGNYEKAMEYMQQVPEAKKSDFSQSSDDAAPGTLGATIILSFDQSAQNVRDYYENATQYKNRLVILQ